jgi:hypothetical protein
MVGSLLSLLNIYIFSKITYLGFRWTYFRYFLLFVVFRARHLPVRAEVAFRSRSDDSEFWLYFFGGSLDGDTSLDSACRFSSSSALYFFILYLKF